MRRNKTLLIIAAVAVMLMGATSASAYYEGWDGWFNSGSLDYDSKTYEYVEGGIGVDDSTVTAVRRDTFYRTAIPAIAFVCAAGPGDSIFVYIATFTGGKATGEISTTGTGLWTGEGYSDRVKNNWLFDFGGTWETYFNYRPDPPTCEGTWTVTGSFPPNVVTGSGGISGERTYCE